MSDEVNVKFGADTGGINSGIKQVGEGVKNFAEAAKGHVEGVTATFGKLQEAMIGIAAIVAGGALFKEMVNATVEATSQVTGLQKAFGMTLEEANLTKSKLDLLGLSPQNYTSMAQRLHRQVKARSESETANGFTAN